MVDGTLDVELALKVLKVLQAQELRGDLWQAVYEPDSDWREVGQIDFAIEDGRVVLTYGQDPMLDVFLDCVSAANSAASDIKERALLGRSRGRGIKKGLVRHHLPSGLKSDRQAIKASLLLLDDVLSDVSSDVSQ